MTVERLEFIGAAVAMLAVAAGMVLYEWSRIKRGRPILKGSEAVVMYWIGYLSLAVLGVTTVIVAVIR